MGVLPGTNKPRSTPASELGDIFQQTNLNLRTPDMRDGNGVKQSRNNGSQHMSYAIAFLRERITCS